MKKRITVLKGDGIGPEIVNEAVKVLNTVGGLYGHVFEFDDVLMGGAAIDTYGVPVTDEGIERCKNCDAVLLGAVGGPKWDVIDPAKRPEKALLKVRSELGLFANLRPTKLFPQLKTASPLANAENIDLLIVRELTGGIYFGEHKTYSENGEAAASDLMIYRESEIERIGRVAFETARKRRGKVASVDKANVLDSSKLWRSVMHRLSSEYPDVEYRDILVDNAAMQLIKNPRDFDVIVTENMFGDILSDEASMLTGSIGMMPSASLSSGTLGMYEPIHGSAPDIAGTGTANPLGTILSAAMMLRYSLGMPAEADAIEAAVDDVLSSGARTADIDDGRPGNRRLTCREMGDAVCERLARRKDSENA